MDFAGTAIRTVQSALGPEITIANNVLQFQKLRIFIMWQTLYPQEMVLVAPQQIYVINARVSVIMTINVTET
jgi:hypothetical protein